MSAPFARIAAPNAPAEAWVYCGEVDAAAALAEAAAAGAGAWLNLLPAPSAAAFPRAALEEGKLTVAHVPVAGPVPPPLLRPARVSSRRLPLILSGFAPWHS